MKLNRFLRRNKSARKRISKSLDYAKLEPKQLLAVDVNVTLSGSMSVRGRAEGPVEVISLGSNRYEVFEDRVSIARVSGVWQNIVIELDTSPLHQDVGVTLTESIANVVVQLDSVTSDVDIVGTVPIDRAIFRGGAGDDDVKINVITNRMTASFAGGGDNRFEAVQSSRRFRFRGEDGNDTVYIGSQVANSVQFGYAGIVAGDGDNTFFHTGYIVENLFVSGGDGNDSFQSVSSARNAVLKLQDGHNLVSFEQGEFERIIYRGGDDTDDLRFAFDVIANRLGIMTFHGEDNIWVNACIVDVFSRSEDGNDSFVFDEGAQIYNDAFVLLGNGSNTFDHKGYILGDLYVASFNPNDRFTITGGTVSGTTRLRPGGQGGGGGI